ncbi:TolC family protein [Aquincola sp. MAHUQ-54]|uniref:TolC family protein n=1 Tax=Aquincola agrisoli TaxID=3119538 RepID=A0AAW9QQ92_9BURK
MHRRTRRGARARGGALAALAACALAAQAQPQTLKQAFEEAWSRQPEALARQAWRDAAQARRQAAEAWTPEPAALELAAKTDRLHRNDGAREHEIGIAVPIWLPGERARSAALAEAEGRSVESRTAAAQARVAAAVREAWWDWQRARAEAGIARDQHGSAQRLAADVARRLAAGDLALADRHQADAAVAAAESAMAQADATLAAARLLLEAAIGGPGSALPGAADTAGPHAPPEPEPEPPPAAAGEPHAALAALRDQALVAERAAALIATQSRANPELTLAATRERGAFGERYAQTLTLGLRIPFGSGPRAEARAAAARAEAAQAQAELVLQQARLAADRDAARLRVDAGRRQAAAADRRAQLAEASRGFFDKSFRLGETDLPTRLRIEAEAADARRQAARQHIELAAAISAWRQALGLLPQ